MAATVYSAVPQGSSRPVRFGLLALHATAGLVGGTVTGAALGLIGGLAGPFPPLLLVGVLMSVAVLEWCRVDLGAYQPQRGVPITWLNWPRAAFMSAYGFVLGAGLFTPYGSTSVIALAAVAALRGDVASGAVVLGVYGLTRTSWELISGVAATSVGLVTATHRAQRTKAILRQPMGLLALGAALTVFLAERP